MFALGLEVSICLDTISISILDLDRFKKDIMIALDILNYFDNLKISISAS